MLEYFEKAASQNNKFEKWRAIRVSVGGVLAWVTN